MINPVWIILFAPLVACALITVFTQRWKTVSALISIFAVLCSFGFSLGLFYLFTQTDGAALTPSPWRWLVVPGILEIGFGAKVDHLSMLMMLVVTGVGAAIHIYSLGYMHDEPGLSRYFACMSLFTFSMLGIVVADNFLQMFIFWELVGVSSYLLIGYWYEKPSAAEAGKKAFLVNRIGDFGFLLGILALWSWTGALRFDDLAAILPRLSIPSGTFAIVALLIFCGAVGKSAQFPLHVWLPDAMEGPTPVSALIHAATMVAAGVYMLARVFFLIAPSAIALDVIAWIGAITAVMAALIAVVQNDIKRVLAYSTLSQLGYMVMAIGLGGRTEAMFHLTTHAFFKALLFLGAGSIIVAYHHAEQNIWKMGGLWKKMPVTFWTFVIGTLALAGVPPLSGFYSKDEILFLAAHKSQILLILGLATALLTAFYMGRLLCVAFLGRPRESHLYEHAHESPAIMTVPLIFLATLSIVGGWGHRVPAFIEMEKIVTAAPHSLLLSIVMIAVPIVGFVGAAAMYARANATDNVLRQTLGKFYTILENKFYFDEMYLWLVRYVQGTIAAICDFFDRWILQRLGIGGLSVGTSLIARTVRLLQTGNVSTYAFLFGLGATIIIYYVVVR
jgi:NADH-quinone oxidoreductase subunit L